MMGKMVGFSFPLCLLVLVGYSTKYVYSAGAPAELTLDVSLVPPYDTVVEHYIGGITKMKVDVQFPEGTTNAVTIELLPSTNVTVMALGTVTITPPPTTAFSKNGAGEVTRHITDETLGQKVQLSTRAVIDLGDVICTAAGSSLADYTYTVEFEAFVVSTTGLADNETHWVSAGVEYDNSNSIWVGQIAHYIRTGTQASTKTPSFNMNSVTDLKMMSLTPITFEAFVPYPNSFIAVEAISLSSTNDHLRVVSLKCKQQSVTTHFEFYGSEAGGSTYLNYPLLKEYGDDCTLYPGGARRLRVELGNVPNKGSRDGVATGDSDKLQFEALVNMKGTAVLNDDYPFGVGVEIDGSEVWVATMNISASAADPITFPLGSYIDVVSGTNTAAKEIGIGFLSKVPITIPQRGEVTFTYKVESARVGGGTPGIMVSQAFVDDMDVGNNVKCVSVTAAYEASIPGGLIDTAYFNITASNHGINETTNLNTAEDVINLTVALASVTGYAVDGDQYTVTISAVDPATAETDTITYTMSGVASYDTNTNHTFELTSNNCSENQFISEGSTFELLLTIETERGSNPESLQIEFPIPANVTDGMFVVCGLEVVSVGKNLICFSKEQILSVANYTTLADGTHEYIAINSKPACNMGLFSDPEEDKLVIKIKAQYKAGVTINKGEEYWFGIGSKYTSTQIWVAQYPVYGQPIYDLNGPGIVTDINVLGTPIEFPGFFKLTRSFNGVDYDTLEIQVASSTNNGTHTHYTLVKPIMASKIGLITENCNPMCGADYDFTFSSFKEYVDIFGDDNQSLLNQVIFLFDNDTSSCMNLPKQGMSPPVFWARINTTLLNIDLSSFTLSVEGAGIACQRHGSGKVLQVSVSYPTSSSIGRFHGDVKFCKNTNSAVGTPNSCDYTCMCPDTAECSEMIVFLSNENTGSLDPTWSLCGLTASNL